MVDPTDPKKKKKIRVQKNTKHVNLSGIKVSKRTGKLVPKGSNKKQGDAKAGLTKQLANEKKRRGANSPKYKELQKRIKRLDREVIIQGGRQESKVRVGNKLKNQPNKSEVKPTNKKRKGMNYSTTK